MKQQFKFLICAVLLLLSVSAVRAQIVIIPYPTTKGAIQIRNYDNFVKDFNKNPDVTDIGGKYDLLSLLLLDATYSKEFFNEAPWLEKLYKVQSATIKEGKVSTTHQTSATDIEQLFKRRGYLNTLLKEMCGDYYVYTNIVSPVHIKDNVAIFAIQASRSVEKSNYYAKYNNGTVEVTHITGQLDYRDDLASAIKREDYGFGIRAGFGVSTINQNVTLNNGMNNESYNGSYDSKFSYSLGVIYDISLNKRNTLFLQPGVHYMQVGAIDKTALPDKIDIELDYIKIPLLLTYKTGVGNGSAFDLYYGLYLSKGIGGSVTLNNDSPIYAFADNSNSFKFNDIDVGLSLGLGFTLKKLHLSLSYDIGASNLSRGSILENSVPDGKVFLANNVIQFNIGYNLNSKKR